MSKLETNVIDTLSGTSNLTIGSTNTSTVTFENGAVTGHMYPAFEARLSSTQSINHNTFTKVQCDTEHFDTDSAYDSSTNYRFTPQVAGKYYCYAQVRGFAGGSDPDGVRLIAVGVYKNGSSVRNYYGFDANLNDMRHMTHYVSTVIDLNGSTDYLEFYGLVNAEDGSSTGVVFNSDQTYFGAYRIGA